MLRVLFLCFLSYVYVSGNIVQTSVGPIQGLPATDGDYTMYMGIPYAYVDPDNVFGNALPHPVFDSVFEAFDDSAICPQLEEFNNTIVGTLDCLHINIYVPNTANSINRLPILASIHGGGFAIGFSGRFTFGPKWLVDKDIILVTFNYRLGPYGFMCLDTPEVPGNQGLRDQVIALEWIKHNIENFGGDPEKVTIFGQSAGSVSVDLHVLSQHELLYDKVIMQGGTAFVMRVIGESDATVPLTLAEKLGLITANIDEALLFLSTVQPLQLIATSLSLGISYNVCIEKDFGQTRFVTDYPINLVNVPKAREVNVMIGIAEYEALLFFGFISPEIIEQMDPFMNYLRDIFDFDEDYLLKMERIMRQFYIGDRWLGTDDVDGIVNFISDSYFGYPSKKSLDKYIENGAENVYFYVFSYDGERNYVKTIHNVSLPGAGHNDEIGYLFDVSFMPEPNDNDQLIIDRMTTLWANFVKYGNPTPSTTELLPVLWPPVTGDPIVYYNITTNLSAGFEKFYDRYAFWDLFFELNEDKMNGYSNSQMMIKFNMLIIALAASFKWLL